MPTERDACTSHMEPSRCSAESCAGNLVRPVCFPVHVPEEATDGHHLREQRCIDLVADASLEGGKGIRIHVLESFALDLPEVDLLSQWPSLRRSFSRSMLRP